MVSSPPNGRPLRARLCPLRKELDAVTCHNTNGRPFGGLRTIDLGAERSRGSST